jgi:parallel beta-helix repeat protein
MRRRRGLGQVLAWGGAVTIVALVSLGSIGALPSAQAAGGGPATAAASVYVVSPSGSDDNPGSLGAPFATIAKAAEVVAPGDTVMLRGGIYRGRVTFTRGGSAAEPIAFIAYQAEVPVIDGEGVAVGEQEALVTVTEGADHVALSGLTVRNSSGAAMKIYGDHATVMGCKVTKAEYQGIQIRGAAGVRCIGNEIWNVCRMNAERELEGGWPAALAAWESKEVSFIGNVVHDNHGEGISVWKGAEDCVIMGNQVYDNWSVNVYLDNAKRALVAANFIYSTADAFQSHRDPAIGVAVADEDYSEWGDEGWKADGGEHVVRNNIILNCSRGISFWKYVPGSGVKDCSFVYNTIAGTWEYGIRISEGENSGTQFANNIVVSRAGETLSVTKTGGLAFRHNLFWDSTGKPSDKFGWGGQRFDFRLWESQSRELKANLWADPQLSDTAAGEPDGAKLTRDSPAMDAGSSAGAPRFDYWGYPRPTDGNGDRIRAPDIGAHEYGAER